PGSPAPLVPPPRLPCPQGRPRQVDTSEQFCPAPCCAYYGWVGLENIRANGYPSGGRWRQFQCLSCKKYFLETQGTPLHGKRVPPEVVGGSETAGLGGRRGRHAGSVSVLLWAGHSQEVCRGVCRAHARRW